MEFLLSIIVYMVGVLIVGGLFVLDLTKDKIESGNGELSFAYGVTALWPIALPVMLSCMVIYIPIYVSKLVVDSLLKYKHGGKRV